MCVFVCVLWTCHLEETSSAQGSANGFGELQLNHIISVTHCIQRSVKLHCISLIGLHVCVGRICTFVGKNTAHNNCEQSHKLSQGYIKGTFIMCTFVKLLVCLFLYSKNLFSVSDVVHFQFSEQGFLSTVA